MMAVSIVEREIKEELGLGHMHVGAGYKARADDWAKVKFLCGVLRVV
jgi:hypothetical protein